MTDDQVKEWLVVHTKCRVLQQGNQTLMIDAARPRSRRWRMSDRLPSTTPTHLSEVSTWRSNRMDMSLKMAPRRMRWRLKLGWGVVGQGMIWMMMRQKHIKVSCARVLCTVCDMAAINICATHSTYGKLNIDGPGVNIDGHTKLLLMNFRAPLQRVYLPHNSPITSKTLYLYSIKGIDKLTRGQVAGLTLGTRIA